MPVTIRYEDEGRIVVWTFEGTWAWEEYYAHRDSVNAAIEATGHPVDMIIDMADSSLLPSNLMSHARNATHKSPTNLRRTVFVGTNAILRTFFKMFSQLYSVMPTGKSLDFIMVATLADAYALLRESDTQNET